MRITFSEEEVHVLLYKANLKLRRAKPGAKSKESLAHALAVVLNEELITRSEGKENELR